MSNSEKLLAAIGEVKDKNIPEVFEEDNGETGELFISSGKKKEKGFLLRWGLAGCGVIAAVSAAAVLGITVLHNLDTYGEPFAPNLPVIEADLYSILNCDEGMWACDVSEIRSNNPWSEDIIISALPVYKDSKEICDDLCDVDSMLEVVAETAGKLGLTEPLCEIDIAYLPWDKEKPQYVRRSYTGDKYGVAKVEVQVGSGGTVVVTFGGDWESGYALSDKYSLDSENEAREALEHVGKEFNYLFGFKNPTACIRNEGRSRANGTLFRSYSVYDSSDNIEESILNYCRHSAWVSFVGNSVKKLEFDTNEEAVELVGKYPIISLEEAIKRLTENEYISEVWAWSENGSNGVITKESIGSAELVYRTVKPGYRMPFYSFRVEIDRTDSPMEMTEYGLFYVPAVEERYLEQLIMEN